MSQKNNTVTTSEREFVMERILDAPRELVFKVWTTPEHLQQWWGPKDWTLPVSNQDFRPGGEWLYCMKGTEGEEAWGKAIYHEIVPPERIVFTDSIVDADGNRPEGMPEIRMTITFTDVGGKTKLTSRAQFASEADRKQMTEMGMVEGFNETFDRLEAYLPTLM